MSSSSVDAFMSRSRHGAARVALAMLALAALASCAEEPPVEAEPVVRPVKMIEFGAGQGAAIVEYSGSIAADQDAAIAFQVSGPIIDLPVSEGQYVSRGAVLARVDARDSEARRDAALADRNVARATYDRFQELYAADAASLQELEVQRRQLEVAEAQLRTAQKAVDDTVLRAPFAGRIASRLVEEFQSATARQPVLILQDSSRLEVVFNIPETDAVIRPGVSPAQRNAELAPSVVVSSLPGRAFPARFREFSSSADPATGTFQVTLSFDPPSDATVLPGMTAKVVVRRATEGEERHLIPAVAVVSDESGNAFVWRIDRSALTVSRAPVVLGEMTGSEIEIDSGLESGDLVAVSGVHNLRNGMQVRRMDG